MKDLVLWRMLEPGSAVEADALPALAELATRPLAARLSYSRAVAETRWTLSEISIGGTAEATFWANPVKDSGFRYRATHLDGRRAPKVVL